MPTTYETREAYLLAMAEKLAPMINERTGLGSRNVKVENGHVAIGSTKIAITCGFPVTGGRMRKNGGMRIGECHHIHGTDRTKFQIAIHPTNATGEEVASVLVHEILHALLPGGVGHRKPFSQAAKKMGLDGKPTATTLGEELTEALKPILDELGEYPHEKLTSQSACRKSPGLKVMCGDCGYVVRVTRKWLDEAGAPICPQCEIQMYEADVDDTAATPLIPVDQNVEYRIKAANGKVNERWSIWMRRQGNDIEWSIIDFGAPMRTITLENGQTQEVAVFDPPKPRRSHAESREDALNLIEAIEGGLMTYKDLGLDDNDPSLDDWSDPDTLEDHEDEGYDFDDDGSAMFDHERERYGDVDEDDFIRILAEREQARREATAKVAV